MHLIQKAKNQKTAAYTYGVIILAMARIRNNAASVTSQVTPDACRLINIDRKQFDDPTMNTTSFIRSDTLLRKSVNSSRSSSKPS